MFGKLFGKKLDMNSLIKTSAWFQTKSSKVIIDIISQDIKYVENIDNWMQYNITEMIKYQQDELLEYLVSKFDGVLYRGNTPNYFILDVLEHRNGRLGLKYFQDIIKNSTFPFFWQSVIIPEAIKTKSWWFIMEVMRTKSIKWHPSENFEELIPAVVKNATSGPGDKTDVEYLIALLKKDKIIQNRALEVMTWDEVEAEIKHSDYEEFINPEVKDVFLF